MRKALLVVAIVIAGAAASTLAAQRILAELGAASLADLQRQADRAARHEAARHRVVQLELRQIAQRIARSELVAWLGLVADYASTLRDPEPFVVDFAKRVAPFRPQATRSALEAEGRAFVSVCRDPRACAASAVVSGLARVQASDEAGAWPELVDVFDPEGRAFEGDARLAVVDEAVRSRSIVRDFDRWPGTDVFHVLVAAPIVEGATVRGIVVVGRPIGARLETEAERVGAALTWTVRGTIGVAATTLPDEDVGHLDERFVTGRQVVSGNVHIDPVIIAALRRDGSAIDEASAELWWVASAITLLTLVALGLVSTRARPRAAVVDVAEHE